MQTERAYVRNLETVTELFMAPLRTEDPYKTYISDDQLKTIFSDIEVILKINKVLLESLESRIGVEFNSETTKLGDVFITIVST